MTKEALKLALEALEGVLDNSPKVLDASISGGLYEVVQCRDAIIAIKEALAQPEQEPTAWCRWSELYKKLVFSAEQPTEEIAWFPLYTVPAQPMPLSIGQILGLWPNSGFPKEVIAFARRIEAWRGIKGLV